MRKLTFQGFLESYVRTLSGIETNSIHKLVKECRKSPRLKEPLFFYALEADKLELLVRCAEKCGEYEIMQWAKTYTRDDLKSDVLRKDSDVPVNFQKVWDSYQYFANRKDHENEMKDLMRGKILEIQGRKKISNYRLYKDLNLNAGNVNTWLKNGAGNKVSIQTAREILQYAKNYPQ